MAASHCCCGKAEGHVSKGWFQKCFGSQRILYLRPSLSLIMPHSIHKLFISAIQKSKLCTLSNTTTPLPQKLNQGINTVFKSHHTCCTLYSITDAIDKAFVKVSEWWKSYRISDCILDTNKSTDILHSVALNVC